jgi:hypothetical protein
VNSEASKGRELLKKNMKFVLNGPDLVIISPRAHDFAKVILYKYIIKVAAVGICVVVFFYGVHSVPVSANV